MIVAACPAEITAQRFTLEGPAKYSVGDVSENWLESVTYNGH